VLLLKLKPFVMIGIALVAIAGALLWYGARPKWHQAWNPKAIQATYVGKSFGSTDSGDYRLQAEASLIPRRKDKSLSMAVKV
jgi:hypothetical protein